MQLDMFSLMRERYKITKPIRLIELFAGIGSQAKALKNIGAKFEHYKVVEFDKYAIASYNAIHGTDFICSDITKIGGTDLEIVDTNKFEYIMTYSFPCQDLSLAGKQAGMKKGDSTRSGLLWEVERLLEECCGYKEHRVSPRNSKYLSMADWVDDYNFDIDKNKLPQILLMENVPQIISKNNINDFNLWQKKLEGLGYKNYIQLLNSKDYEIPQNRNRCFMISILGDYSYSFPPKMKLQLRLKDMLEDEVDEKYYLSEKLIKCFTSNGTGKYPGGERFEQNLNRPNQHIANSITTSAGNRATDNFILNEPICLNSKVNGKQPSLQNRIYDSNGLYTAITTSFYPSITDNLKIRKLTPKECFRLMGFDDSDFNKASKVNSNAQLYKQAGNSIVVNVLEAIVKQLL